MLHNPKPKPIGKPSQSFVCQLKWAKMLCSHSVFRIISACAEVFLYLPTELKASPLLLISLCFIIFFLYKNMYVIVYLLQIGFWFWYWNRNY